MKDLHILPKIRDSWSYLYVEHCKIDQDGKAIALHDERGLVPVPCASLAALMLGPGTNITHAAIRTLAECGCSVLWTGEEGVRLYAQGLGETRSSRRLLGQAVLASDAQKRLDVVMRMYRARFTDPLEQGLTLQQIRGKEGIRVREAYARASRESGVPWSGRWYDRQNWGGADPVNRALSAANSCLYGICHAAIVSAGYSPALGFVHTGKLLSFVYDVADLYKVELTVPIAFRAVANGTAKLEQRVRLACREAFRSMRLMQRIVPDIDQMLFGHPFVGDEEEPMDADEALPGGIWDAEMGEVSGGKNWADEGG